MPLKLYLLVGLAYSCFFCTDILIRKYSVNANSFSFILKHLEWQTQSPVFVLKKLVPTNLAAWLFLGSLMFYFKSDLNRLTAILFLGIAVLTAPHIGVISSMLQSQKMKA